MIEDTTTLIIVRRFLFLCVDRRYMSHLETHRCTGVFVRGGTNLSVCTFDYLLYYSLHTTLALRIFFIFIRDWRHFRETGSVLTIRDVRTNPINVYNSEKAKIVTCSNDTTSSSSIFSHRYDFFMLGTLLCGIDGNLTTTTTSGRTDWCR